MMTETSMIGMTKSTLRRDPSQATVSVTDNDELQIITVHPHEAFVREGGEAKFVFRRTGDTSEELRFTYMREQRQAETTDFLNYLPISETIPGRSI